MSLIVITGADGHLGQALATDLLDRTESRLALFCRGDDEPARARKLTRLGRLAGNPRCQVIFGDLDSLEPMAELAREDIRYVVHCAAATDFGVVRELAQRVNVDGTQRVVDFARACPNLERFVFPGSLYAAGLREGSVSEEFLEEPAEFANHYEWSKWEAERILQAADDLPWQIYRVGTILCDDISGRVSQFNVIHNTLSLLYYGLLSVVPGAADTRVYITTTDSTVATIVQQMHDGEDRRILNVTNPGDLSLSLRDLLDRVYDAFMRDERFAKHGVLKPLFCDWESFETLAQSIDSFGGAMAQSLKSIFPFARQLFSDKDVQVSTQDVYGSTADVGDLIDATCDYLTATRWGRETGEGRQCA